MRRAILTVLALGIVSAGTRLWAAAPPCRYSIEDDTVFDRDTGLTWQRYVSGPSRTWPDAIAYCGTLDLADHASGWRLPSKKELESLVDVRVSNPAIDVLAFPATPSDGFWTSTPNLALAGTVWGVYFGLGNTFHNYPTTPFRARCVR